MSTRGRRLPTFTGGRVTMVWPGSLARVSGSAGQESSLANQEIELRGSSTGTIFRVYQDRASGLPENRAGLTALLNDAASRKFTVVRVVHKGRLARFGT